MVRDTLGAILLVGAAVGGCNGPADAPAFDVGNANSGNTETRDAVTPIAAPNRPAPNYDERDGQTYMYVSAVSEDERKEGKVLGEVSMLQYRGIRHGRHAIDSVDDVGRTTVRYECSNPCRIIRRDVAGKPSRIPYDPGSVIGAAFEDALNGNLEPAKAIAARAAPSTNTSSEVARIPAQFLGDWNGDLAACGTGQSDTRLRVEPKRLRFYESDAEVRSVKLQNSRAMTVQASFAGEGEVWSDQVTLVLSRSGEQLSSGELVRYKCPAVR